MTTRLAQYKLHFEKLLQLFNAYPVHVKYSCLSPALQDVCIFKSLELCGKRATLNLIKKDNWDALLELFPSDLNGVSRDELRQLLENETQETKENIKKQIMVLCIIATS